MKAMDLKKKVHIWDYIFNNIIYIYNKIMSRKRKDLEKDYNLTGDLNSEDDFYTLAEQFISSYLDLLDINLENDESG